MLDKTTPLLIDVAPVQTKDPYNLIRTILKTIYTFVHLAKRSSLMISIAQQPNNITVSPPSSIKFSRNQARDLKLCHVKQKLEKLENK